MAFFGTRYREEMDEPVAREFDGIYELLKAVFFREHNEDGTHNLGIKAGAEGGRTGESARGLKDTSHALTLVQNIVQEMSDNGDIGGSGDVVGPSSATDGRIATFNGTTGKMIQDGGTLLSDLLSNLVGNFRIATFTLSESDIDTLSTSPKVIASAAGAGKLLMPLMCGLKITTTDAYTSNPTFAIRWAGRATNLSVANPFGLNGTGITVVGFLPITNTAPLDVSVFDARNKGLTIALSADPADGAATGSGALAYVILDLS